MVLTPAITDLLTKVGNPGSATTLSAPGYTDGVSTGINVGSTTNWPTDTKVYFVIDRAEIVDGVEQRILGTYNEFSGIVTSSGVISNLEHEFGTPQSYPAGSLTRVYIPVSASRENALIDGLGSQHNLDGTHKDVTTNSLSVSTSLSLPNNSIVTAFINALAITAAKIAAEAVTTSKIAIGTIVETNSTTDRTIGSSLASLSETIAITAGTWEIWYNVCIRNLTTSNLSQGGNVGLSTSTSSYTHPALRSLFSAGIDTASSSNKDKAVSVHAREIVKVTGNTTFYLIGQRANSSDSTILGSVMPTAIRARKISDQTT